MNNLNNSAVDRTLSSLSDCVTHTTKNVVTTAACDAVASDCRRQLHCQVSEYIVAYGHHNTEEPGYWCAYEESVLQDIISRAMIILVTQDIKRRLTNADTEEA